MLYRLTRPMKRKDSSKQQFIKRIPSDVKSDLVGKTLVIPMDCYSVEVKVTDKTQAIRFSLRTSDPHEVRKRQAEVSAYLESYFEQVRSGDRLSLSHKNAVALAGDAYRAWSSSLDEVPVVSATHMPETGEWVVKTEQPNSEDIEILKEALPTATSKLSESHTESLRPIVERILKARGLVPERLDDASWSHLLKATQQAIIDGMNESAKQMGGDYTPDPNALRFPEWEEPKVKAKRNPTSQSLEELLEGWWKESEAAGLSPRTYEGYKKAIDTLGIFLKYKDAQMITKQDIIDFKDYLFNEERPKLGRTLSNRTIKYSYLAGIKSVLNWTVSNNKINSNPALGVTIKDSKSPKPRNDTFSQDEISSLLSASLACVKNPREPLQRFGLKRWVPWLLAYSGARAGEIIQLRKQDLREYNGHWIITITPDAGTVKTKKWRDVPLHPHLIEQGFMEYFKSCKQDRLFIWRDDADMAIALKYALKILRAFVRLHITDPKVKPNHAWRHTFKSYGRKASIEYLALDIICGHAPATVGGEYGDEWLDTLIKVIANYPRHELAASKPPK